MLDSLVLVRYHGEGRVYAICDDRPGRSFLVNLKSGKSDWFKSDKVKFLNEPTKKDQNQAEKEE